MIGIKFDTDELQDKLMKLAGQLSGEQMVRAIYLGINKTATKVRTESDREIRKIYNIRQEWVLRTLRIIKGHAGKPTAEILMPTKPVPMSEYLKTKQVGAGVSVEIKKGDRKVVKGAFLFVSKFNNTAKASPFMVMHRSNAEDGTSYTGSFQFRHKRKVKTGMDLPIGAMFSPSVFSSVFNDTVKKNIVKIGEEKLQDNIFEMLDKSVAGVIRNANSRYRRK